SRLPRAAPVASARTAPGRSTSGSGIPSSISLRQAAQRPLALSRSATYQPSAGGRQAGSTAPRAEKSMEQQTQTSPIFALDSVTQIDERCVGLVLIAASHGGVYSGYLAARGRVRAAIFNDAGVGLDEAGIGGLAYL